MRGLPLALAGPGGHPDPLELALQGFLAGLVDSLLAGQPGLLLLQPRRVVALPGDARTPVELEDPSGHVVEEVAVVGDGDHRPRVVLQGALEPGHRLGVEVVGRLVEEEQVGPGEEEPAERHPAALPTRQGGDVRVSGRQAEGVHGDLERPIEVPGTGGIDLVLELALLGEQLVEVGVGLAHGRAHRVEPVHQCLYLAYTLGHVAQDVLGGIELRLLGKEPDSEAAGQPGLAGETVVFPGHDAQEGRLAGAIGSDDAELRPRIEGEVDALEHLPVGRIEPPQVTHGVDVLGCHGDQCASPEDGFRPHRPGRWPRMRISVPHRGRTRGPGPPGPW